VLCLSAQPAIGCGQTDTTISFSPTRQLSGLSAEEAAAVIANLAEAERKLKAGHTLAFELLAGAQASHAMTKVSPRDAFLQIPFKQVWNLERVPTANLLWQPYRLAFVPNGLGQLYWDIEVVLGVDGNVERVLMIYKTPAPF